MRANRLVTMVALVLAIPLAACAGTASTQDADSTAGAPAPAGGNDDGGSDAAASVQVSITGGEFEGTYSGSVPDGGCSRGATGENTFGLQYSTAEDVELSSVQLVVNDAEAAGSSGTDDFMTTLTFGDLLEGTSLELQPQEGTGSGTVNVDDRGDSATITIAGETSDGVGVDATVECHSVFDFGS